MADTRRVPADDRFGACPLAGVNRLGKQMGQSRANCLSIKCRIQRRRNLPKNLRLTQNHRVQATRNLHQVRYGCIPGERVQVRPKVIQGDVLKTRQEQLNLRQTRLKVAGCCVDFEAVTRRKNDGFIHNLGLGTATACYFQCLEIIEGTAEHTPRHCQLFADFNGCGLIVKTNCNHLHAGNPACAEG